jgi:hypothetical protein
MPGERSARHRARASAGNARYAWSFARSTARLSLAAADSIDVAGGLSTALTGGWPGSSHPPDAGLAS